MEKATLSYKLNGALTISKDQVLLVEGLNGHISPIKVKGDIYLKTYPKLRYQFNIETRNPLFEKYLNNGEKLLIKNGTTSFECLVTQVDKVYLDQYNVTLKNCSNIVGENKVKGLTSATFIVINFPFCLGSPLKRIDQRWSSYLGRIGLNIGDWSILMDKVDSYKMIQGNMEESDGYTVTYAGSISKKKGAKFTSDDLLGVLNKLFWLLSFSRGAFTSPILVEGFNNKDELVWNDRSIRSVDRWSLTQNNNWFCTQNVNKIYKELYPGWDNLLENDLWKKELPKVIYWYTYSGRGVQGAGTDGSIILALSALELLAYNYLVIDKGIRNEEKFEKKPLSNNLFNLLHELNIPTKMSRHLPELSSYAGNKNWGNGPKAISELRNEIVHPDRNSSPGTMVCYEGLQLSLWYVEMILLRMCEYKGIYNNRLKRLGWKGEVEVVPWEKN